MRHSIIAAASLSLAQASGPTDLNGSILPKINSWTWQGWQPSTEFEEAFTRWPEKRVPEEVRTWCKGFIPKNASALMVGDTSVMPITGPGGIPIPGLLGQCAGIDGRSWSNVYPDTTRPTDARFWASMSVANGSGSSTTTVANCGMSHNICCNKKGCWDGAKYGDVTCSKHCADSEMKMERLACWPLDAVSKGKWPTEGVTCDSVESIAAAKVYVQGRGGNPCGTVLNVPSPVANWDVGMAIFPTKRKVTITGYVDDAPAYECYAQAKDDGKWGEPVTLAQIQMDVQDNIAIALAGFSDVPINPKELVFDLPEPVSSVADVVV